MLHEFRNFNADRMDIHELVALAAFGKQIRAEYEAHNLEEPDWVDTQLKSLRREIHARNADRLEAELKQKKQKLDNLKTPEQKRTELKREIKELESQLQTV